MQDLVFLRILDRVLKEHDEPGQRVLVHGLHVGQARDAEEEVAGISRDLLVLKPSLINLLLSLLCDLLLHVNLVRELLGRGNHVDCRLILENVALGRAEDLNDLVLNLLELSGILSRLEHQFDLLLLKLRPFHGHSQRKELIFQALLGDHEVQEGHLDTDFWQVVRVPKFGCDVKVELGVVLNHRVAQLDADAAALLEGRSRQQRLEGGIELLSNVLEENWEAKLDAVLEFSDVVAVI